MKLLFSPFRLGRHELKNRIVMAPMTRCRASGGFANEMMAQYYGLRAEAGLIVTEGTSPSPNGLGYARIPGLYSEAQSESWKPVAEAVHRRGGVIFLQLMHTGRVSHLANMPEGARVLAPSAIPLKQTEMWTDSQGMQPHSAPAAMSLDDIRRTVDEFARSAKLAVAAGLDGIELHSANGYLLEQFLNPASNQRLDAYGGSAESRRRFVIEVAEATAAAIGADRVGIRISPHGVFNEMSGEYDGMLESYLELARAFARIGLAYLHLVDHSAMGAPKVADETKEKLRREFPKAFILSGGYDADRAETDLEKGRGDLIAFGRPFISNPRLPELLQKGLALLPSDPVTYYSPGEKGYLDYPADS